MVDSELKIHQQNPSGYSSPSGTTPTTENVPKAIFANMTRDEAIKYNLLDEFNKANTTQDDVITEEEFNEYNKPKDITGASGKRTAVGGIYIVQKGDTLSKIAADFGISVDALYTANKEVIGANKNLIQIGQQLSIVAYAKKEETLAAKQQAKLQSIKIPDGMKSTLSELTGIDFNNMSTEEIANRIADMDLETITKLVSSTLNNCDKKDKQDFRSQLAIGDDSGKAALRSLMIQLSSESGAEEIFEALANALGKSVDECKHMTLKELTQLASSLPDENRSKLFKTLSNATLDQEITLPGMGDGSSDVDLFRYCGIDISSVPKEERSKKLAAAYVEKQNADLDRNNKTSLYNVHLDNLKKGNFTKRERESLASRKIDLSTIDNKMLEKMAEQRVHNAYLKALNETSVDLAIFKHDKDLYIDHIRAVSMSDIPAKAEAAGVSTKSIAATNALIVQDDSFTEEEKREISNVLIECREGLGTEYLDDEDFAVYSAAVLDNADDEHRTDYVNDYASRSEILNDVITALSNNTTDTTKKDSFAKLLETVTANASTQGSGATNTRDRYTTSQNSGVTNVMTIREENERLMREKYGIDTTPTNVTKQNAVRAVNRLSIELNSVEQRRYTPEKIANMRQFVQDAISGYDSLSEEQRNILKAYLDGTKSQTQNLISFMFDGGKEIEKFMLQEKYITVDDLRLHIRSCPDDFDRFSDYVKGLTAKETHSRVLAGTLRENQMTDGELKMYRYYKNE